MHGVQPLAANKPAPDDAIAYALRNRVQLYRDAKIVEVVYFSIDGMFWIRAMLNPNMPGPIENYE